MPKAVALSGTAIAALIDAAPRKRSREKLEGAGAVRQRLARPGRQPCFSSALISPKVRECPSGRNIGS